MLSQFDLVIYQVMEDDNLNANLIQDINHVIFGKLKRLSLLRNNINNIQALCWIDMKYLQCIVLNQNRIYKISCLKKLQLPYFDHLYLIQNPVKQINSLTYANFNKFKMQRLFLQSQTCQYVTPEDISVVMKMNSQKIAQFKITCTKRIKQSKVAHMLFLRNIEVTFE